MATYINTKYGYTIQTWDSGAKIITVCDADGEELEFDGKNGFLTIAGSYDEEEPFRWTLTECIDSTREWFYDWNITDEVADSIIADLTEWFAKYCISEEESIQDEIKELRERIDRRKKDIDMYSKRLAVCKKEAIKIENQMADYIECIESMHMAIGSMYAEIYKLNEQLKGGK